jgi:hypothetical protein
MMNEDYPDSYETERTPNAGRWAVFLFALILGVIGVYGIIVSTSLDMIPLYMFLYVPLVVFLLYASFRWAKGRPIAPTSITEDDRILETMRKHALPVEETLGGSYRCPNCNNSFDISNAIPVESDVYLCPFCDTRLHIK